MTEDDCEVLHRVGGLLLVKCCVSEGDLELSEGSERFKLSVQVSEQ